MLANGPTSNKMSQFVTNTVVDPGTVVVHFYYASFAHTTVVRWTRLVRVAPCTWQRGQFNPQHCAIWSSKERFEISYKHCWHTSGNYRIRGQFHRSFEEVEHQEEQTLGLSAWSSSAGIKVKTKYEGLNLLFCFVLRGLTRSQINRREAEWIVTLTWHHSDIHHSAWKKPRIVKPTKPKLVLYI